MKKISFKKNWPLVITGLVALGLVGAAAYVHFSRPSNTHTADTTPTNHPGAGAAGVNDTNGGSAGAGASGINSSSQNGSTTSPAPAGATDPKYSSSTLAKPTQSINKSHDYISLGATDAQHSPALDSTCNTVSGATCEIHATLGSTMIIVVPATPVNATTFGIDEAWNAKDVGLTPGMWAITAVARKDGQTAASDPIALDVRA